METEASSQDVVTTPSSGKQSPTNKNRITSMTAKMNLNPSLRDLQTDEQRRILDIVSQIRKCGLDSVLSLPQIVVCGDQSAGKSSVLEALTEIPFPRSDNLCTRFATEISLRQDQVDNLTIRVIPDPSRPEDEQIEIQTYSETIIDFSELPTVMENAKKAMGICDSGSVFAKDVLSIEICGPGRPQLTIVDIPGLIQSSTSGVSEADVKLVGEITDRYIEQPRTICLAVISAGNDAANQPILTKVRKFDPEGDRTLGIITKLDKLDEGSGSEENFLQLARNEDVKFKLGWHAIKNRKFEERDFSYEERNRAEEEFFRTSTFSRLVKETVGIDALRIRLSQLLFGHVKKELPRLHRDLETALNNNRNKLQRLGESRSSVTECRMFLARLNMECYELSKAAVGGNYEHRHFQVEGDTKSETVLYPSDFFNHYPSYYRRLRAAIQFHNLKFAEIVRVGGHKYKIMDTGPGQSDDDLSQSKSFLIVVMGRQMEVMNSKAPKTISKADALQWVGRLLLRSRGTELVGNFNPRLVAELFWEQTEKWEELAKPHIHEVCRSTRAFLVDLLSSRAPEDVHQRMHREHEALEELKNLIQDLKELPINYNHYYTDNIHKKRQDRLLTQLRGHIPAEYRVNGTVNTTKVVEETVAKWGESLDADMEKFACEEALDCMIAFYKVQQKVFIANVTTQVIERRMIRGLENIFSPMMAISIPDDMLQTLVSEPEATKRDRAFFEDRVKKLEEGQKIFQGVLGSWN
ncbi:hypothetical protein N0V82_007621 [Gnomoniopsis sp. IMI 355080]|nr:hypothetical protein N0V82_007621 [Gnomoniopsis sp. IMI 355080]